MYIKVAPPVTKETGDVELINIVFSNYYAIFGNIKWRTKNIKDFCKILLEFEK